MGIFHFLNVNDGDCSIIQHPSGNVTVIDVCNASLDTRASQTLAGKKTIYSINQKDYPVNPIAYMLERDITSVFRFILTHCEMDHMGGIRDFFAAFAPANFWDTANRCEKDEWNGSPHSQEDWDFYIGMRDGLSLHGVKRLVLYSGARGQHYNTGPLGGDGLYVLAPTPELMAEANRCADYNDASYVILYRSRAGRILLAGDSHDKTWEYILTHHFADVYNVDLLIAPHHGRSSGRSYNFLDIVQPTLTFFGNAPSEHLAYGAWNSRGLPFITNNQADCLVVDTSDTVMQVYCTNASYARERTPNTFYSPQHKAFYVGYISLASSRPHDFAQARITTGLVRTGRNGAVKIASGLLR